MEIQDAVQWTDKFIFAKTGQHLDSLQRAILEGVWEHKGYKDIAEEYHCSNDHVRKSASELWKLLSEMLGEEVKKKNVRSLIENRVFSYHNNVVQIGSNINICNDLYNNPKKNDRPLQPAKPVNRATISAKLPNIRTSTTAPHNWRLSNNGYSNKIAASSP
nr:MULTISPECIES: hypothetical protein [unclassified Roseofilum]